MTEKKKNLNIYLGEEKKSEKEKYTCICIHTEEKSLWPYLHIQAKLNIIFMMSSLI